MHKEPIGLYIFRFVVGFGMFVFMCMLYWSSVLVEDNLRDARKDITDLKNDILDLRTETERVREDVLKTLLQNQKIWRSGTFQPGQSTLGDKEVMQGTSTINGQRPHMDPSLPNLLTGDPFYAITLPKLLGKDFKPQGTFHGATIGKPDNLHPFSNWSHVSAWISQCSVSLARLQFGKYETFSPDMAIKIEARKMKGSDNPEFWVHLRDKVYWQPLSERLFPQKLKLAPHFLRKHQVTAEDYKFYFDALMNPYVQEPGAVASRNYLGDIEEIEVIDKLTFVVRWKTHNVVDEQGNTAPRIKYVARLMTGGLTPLPSFVYKYFSDGTKIVEDDRAPETYRNDSIWAQNFSNHWAKNIIVSCGPWIFDGMTDRQIRFQRNPNHYFPLDALAEKMDVQFKNTTNAIWQDFKASRLDTHNLQPDQLIELQNFLDSEIYAEQIDKVKRLDYTSRTYLYVGWNQEQPYFQSKKVRLAMTLAIDRTRIIKQYLNGMGIELTGPFSYSSSSYDHSIKPWPFNLQRARELLEGEGWYDSDGDGTIDKMIDGKIVPFQFSLTYYVKNPTTKAICEYIATALREVGVKCNLNGVDIADLSTDFEGKNFDALCLGWALGTPPEDPRQLWHSAGAKEQGSSNAVGFVNAEADTIIEKLAFEDDPEKRRELYHRFHAIIHEEQPYTFLYVPKTALLYRDYLQNVFIPSERQDLVPGANNDQPISSAFWIMKE